MLCYVAYFTFLVVCCFALWLNYRLVHKEVKRVALWRTVDTTVAHSGHIVKVHWSVSTMDDEMTCYWRPTRPIPAVLYPALSVDSTPWTDGPSPLGYVSLCGFLRCAVIIIDSRSAAVRNVVVLIAFLWTETTWYWRRGRLMTLNEPSSLKLWKFGHAVE